MKTLQNPWLAPVDWIPENFNFQWWYGISTDNLQSLLQSNFKSGFIYLFLFYSSKILYNLRRKGVSNFATHTFYSQYRKPVFGENDGTFADYVIPIVVIR